MTSSRCTVYLTDPRSPRTGKEMQRDAQIVLLDGPVGTELTRLGIDTSLPKWSASAVFDAPAVLSKIHAAYADAGATLHTANTFRTQRRALERGGPIWASVSRQDVLDCASANFVQQLHDTPCIENASVSGQGFWDQLVKRLSERMVDTRVKKSAHEVE